MHEFILLSQRDDMASIHETVRVNPQALCENLEGTFLTPRERPFVSIAWLRIGRCREPSGTPARPGSAGLPQPARDTNASWLPSLRSKRGDWQQLLESLSALYLRGAEIDWAGFDRGHLRRKVELPTYPFERQRFPTPKPREPSRNGSGSPHPLVDTLVRSPLVKAAVPTAPLRSRPRQRGEGAIQEAPRHRVACRGLGRDCVRPLLSVDRRPVAYRNGERYVARFVRHRETRAAAPAAPFCLHLAGYGSRDRLRLVPLTRRSPGPGAVEIEVKAAALNFRAVLIALGMLRDYSSQVLKIDRAEDVRFGFDCAGTITAIGEGVTDFNIGDEVMSSAAGSCASFFTVPRIDVVPKPAGLSFEEAAAIPTAFLTAHFGLLQLAKLKPGAGNVPGRSHESKSSALFHYSREHGRRGGSCHLRSRGCSGRLECHTERREARSAGN